MPLSKKTKILCTLGPATDKRTTLERMIRAGMNMARINMSHGSHEDHARRLGQLTRAAKATDRFIGVLVDLQGPKLRIGKLGEDGLDLQKGQLVQIGGRRTSDIDAWLPLDFKSLAAELKTGDTILLADGTLELRTVDTHHGVVTAKVVRGGHLTSHKGINVPGRALSVPAFTQKDKADLAFGLKHEADYFALSFVRTAKDIKAVKSAMKRAGMLRPVIAKIEKPQALDDIDNIIDVADGIMVARGDLGVELSVERVPAVQKTLIHQCANADKWVIVATQMLETMIEHDTPTRAEASDVANAVYDGADCLMLSGETAVGQYPVRTVEMMAKVCRASEATTELDRPENAWRRRRSDLPKLGASRQLYRAIVDAAIVLLGQSDATALWVFTQSGRTAHLVSKSRPGKPVYAFSPDPATLRYLSGHWGLHPLRVPMAKSTDEMVRTGERAACDGHCARSGDRVVVLAGEAPTVGATNIAKVHHVRG